MDHRLFSSVAQAFARQDELGTQLSRALQVLCVGLRLSRAYVYIDGQNRPTMGYTHEWCADGIEQQWMEDIPYASYATWKQMLMDTGPIVANDIAGLPEEWRSMLASRSILSLQAYPIRFGPQLVGFIGFDDSRQRRVWTTDETELLSASSGLIAAFCEAEIMREHFRSGQWLTDEQADNLSIHDPLTGAYNRRYIFDRLQGFDAEYARLGRNFCITMLDLDDFESINTRFGREAGDRVLREFAALVNASIRPYDISGRYGEDAFIIVSVNASALETGYLIARIMTAVKNHVFRFDGEDVQLGFSYGIADSSEFLPENLSIDQMVSMAEQRLLEARAAEKDAAEANAAEAIASEDIVE